MEIYFAYTSRPVLKFFLHIFLDGYSIAGNLGGNIFREKSNEGSRINFRVFLFHDCAWLGTPTKIH